LRENDREKERKKVMVCGKPKDCISIYRSLNGRDGSILIISNGLRQHLGSKLGIELSMQRKYPISLTN
jgi:hypothetical protein